MRSVGRTLSVLRALCGVTTGLSLGELAAQVDIPTPSLHRLLAVLCAEGFVTRSPGGRRYFLGPDATLLGNAGTRSSHLFHVPPGPIASASIESGETVFLTEWIDERAICIAIAPSRKPLQLYATLGQRMPLYAAASARVLLADMPDMHAQRRLERQPMRRFTNYTPTTMDKVMDQVRLARRRGFDVCDRALDNDVWAVAAPVRRGSTAITKSITVAAPTTRVRRPHVRESLIGLAIRTADEISHAPTQSARSDGIGSQSA